MMPSSSQRLGLNSFVNCRLWDSNLDGEKFKRWRLWRSSHKSVPKSRAQLDSRTSGLGPTASLWWYRVIANSKRKCRTSHVASIQRVLKKRESNLHFFTLDLTNTDLHQVRFCILYRIHQMVSRIFCNYEFTSFSRNWVRLSILMYC